MAHRIIDACNGCSACEEQCPVAAIDGVFRERYSINAELCIDCGVCGWVCPKAAVLDAGGVVVPRLRRDQRPRPVVDPDLCNGCGKCLEACPFDCRELVGRQHAGISYLAAPERCVACGECESACLKGAVVCGPLDLRTFDPQEFARKLAALL